MPPKKITKTAYSDTDDLIIHETYILTGKDREHSSMPTRFTVCTGVSAGNMGPPRFWHWSNDVNCIACTTEAMRDAAGLVHRVVRAGGPRSVVCTGMRVYLGHGSEVVVAVKGPVTCLACLAK